MLKKIKQVKADKGFRIWDLIIYGVIIALVAALFIVFFTGGKKEPLSGVRIYLKGETVFEYEFESVPKVLSDSVELKEENNGLTVTVRSGNGDYNVIFINVSEKTVKMNDANCRNKDCVFIPVMDNNGSMPIICSPHGIKVEPYTNSIKDNDLIIG